MLYVNLGLLFTFHLRFYFFLIYLKKNMDICNSAQLWLVLINTCIEIFMNNNTFIYMVFFNGRNMLKNNEIAAVKYENEANAVRH